MSKVREVVVIGGGVIGLAIALDLQQQGISVTILSQDFAQAASHAAAGMLAPQAEHLTPGPMLDLCLRSRSMYPKWIHTLETLTGQSTGYWPCGILAPVYEADAGIDQAAIGPEPVSCWLDRSSIHQQQPGLSGEVVGGWWYPEDAQVDNRLLTKTLRIVAQERGVDIRDGVKVTQLLQHHDRITSVQTSSGTWYAEHYVLATGAWSHDILPIPVFPKKGQMLALRSAEPSPTLPLQTVLFGQEIYIVPRQDGRIILGATSENVGFAPHNTPAGIQALLTAALRLYPGLDAMPIHDMWWGFRPATPDEQPILGASPYENLTLATGHYRNGILLAPVTAALTIAHILGRSDPILPHFHWSRFLQLEA